MAPRRLYSSSTVPTSQTVASRRFAVSLWASSSSAAQPPRLSRKLPSTRVPWSLRNLGL